ncbi:SLC47A2; solute carrier family 47, member 2 [Methanocaldococcus infernus ME]|uniref:SLC47A2 solute carrier family 47, member 2 n=1 Tax=Methanocaldococcus infernus (strain DSM 11812 / JCM 15783 / ME) TaxID=573063 RepID=D5VTR1_METIM|nr:hypothetical protein [Methanocaldococcus infernus]ADG13964.1 SLC47A2; solute carrier family 47, member 2 [Methanocaldococcus infernus ME]
MLCMIGAVFAESTVLKAFAAGAAAGLELAEGSPMGVLTAAEGIGVTGLYWGLALCVVGTACLPVTATLLAIGAAA